MKIKCPEGSRRCVSMTLGLFVESTTPFRGIHARPALGMSGTMQGARKIMTGEVFILRRAIIKGSKGVTSPES